MEANSFCYSPNSVANVMKFDDKISFEVELSTIASTASFSIWFMRTNSASEQVLLSCGSGKLIAYFEKSNFDFL